MSLWHRGDMKHTRGGNYGKSTCFIKMIFFGKAKEVGGFGAGKDGNEATYSAVIEGGFKSHGSENKKYVYLLCFGLVLLRKTIQIHCRNFLLYKKSIFYTESPPLLSKNNFGNIYEKKN